MTEYYLVAFPSALLSLIIYLNKDYLIDLVHEIAHHHKFLSEDTRAILKGLLTPLSDIICFLYNSITDLFGMLYKGISTHYSNSGSILEFFSPMPIFSFFSRKRSRIELSDPSLLHPIDSLETNNLDQQHNNIEFTMNYIDPVPNQITLNASHLEWQNIETSGNVKLHNDIVFYDFMQSLSIALFSNKKTEFCLESFSKLNPLPFSKPIMEKNDRITQEVSDSIYDGYSSFYNLIFNKGSYLVKYGLTKSDSIEILEKFTRLMLAYKIMCNYEVMKIILLKEDNVAKFVEKVSKNTVFSLNNLEIKALSFLLDSNIEIYSKNPGSGYQCTTKTDENYEEKIKFLFDGAKCVPIKGSTILQPENQSLKMLEQTKEDSDFVMDFKRIDMQNYLF